MVFYLEMLEENASTVWELDPEEATFAQMCEGLDKLREKLGDQFCTPCRCSACGACEEKCPNDLPIRERLEELKALA